MRRRDGGALPCWVSRGEEIGCRASGVCGQRRRRGTAQAIRWVAREATDSIGITSGRNE
jgi:hypothetical protein